jgi:hypothetical protein
MPLAGDVGAEIALDVGDDAELAAEDPTACASSRGMAADGRRPAGNLAATIGGLASSSSCKPRL